MGNRVLDQIKVSTSLTDFNGEGTEILVANNGAILAVFWNGDLEGNDDVTDELVDDINEDTKIFG